MKTTKSKLKAFIVLAFVLVMVAYFVLVMFVMSADAASECDVSETWVRIEVDEYEFTPQIYGWVYFLNKCGEEWLIPIDPRAFVADLSQTRCLESPCNNDPILEPEGKQP